MTKKRMTRRRALALTVAAGVVGTGCLGVVLAESAGAATPAAGPAQTQSTHIVPMAAPSASPASTPATGSAAPSAPSAPSSPPSAANAASTGKAPGPAEPSAGPAQQVQLAPTQLPAPSTEKWAATGKPSTRSIAGHDIGENECAKVDGAAAWTQQAFTGGAGQNVAIQDTFVFTSPGAARSAYQNVIAGMNGCQGTTRALQAANKTPPDAEVERTAAGAQADAWKRTWTGVMGMSAEGPQTNHYYLAVNGTRLILLQFTEFPGQAAPYDVAADHQVLAMLDAELSA
jgi:hypothetical protein